MRVPVIFHGVLCPSREELGYLAPSVAMDLMKPHELQLFFSGPFLALDIRFQVVIPPLAALLPRTFVHEI